MPESQRDTAQRKRADARKGRRKTSDDHDESTEAPPSEDGISAEEQPLEAVKHAAKVAAASAALGAVAAAARALAERRGSEDEEHESQNGEQEPQSAPDPEQQPAAEAEPDKPEESGDDQGAEPEPRPPEAPRARQEDAHGASPEKAREVVEKARRQLGALLGKEPETVSSLESTGDGWLATLEVVEVPRIPESTDVLASYEIELDEDLNLRRYARVRRYHRSQAERGGA